MNRFVLLFSFLFSLIVLISLSSGVKAEHSWNNYHWGRTVNPFILNLGDNLSTDWDSYLLNASNDWSASLVLDTVIVPGNTTAKRCKPTIGRVEACNSTYGKNGWLGIAQVWVSGSHITQGVVKINDTYFNTAKYSSPAWKSLVMCQEVAHTFGLDHQDEIFDNPNLGTCMDYTDSPSGNEHPNAHDFEMLEIIYAHLDSASTLQNGVSKLTLGSLISQIAQNQDFSDQRSWGRELRNNGQIALFEKDFGMGHKLLTFVIFARE